MYKTARILQTLIVQSSPQTKGWSGSWSFWWRSGSCFVTTIGER